MLNKDLQCSRIPFIFTWLAENSLGIKHTSDPLLSY